MDEAEYCDRLGLIYRGELIASGPPEALKTECMEDDVLELLCDHPEAVLEAAVALPAVKEAALFGRGLHLVAEDGEQAAEQVRELLAEQGRRAERIERVLPSLEDVFVSLIEARDRASEPIEGVKR
jgi:ABC-2 type transport system ATP-binding protein